MKLKEMPRSAAVAWSPLASKSNLIAAGTVAGAIDDSFASTGSLEILEVDFSNMGDQMTVKGKVEVSDRFNKLAWGMKGVSEGSHPYGLLAGGMVDGTVNIWNAASIAG